MSTKQEIKLEGGAAVLERLLCKRFGALTEEASTRLNCATLEQVES